MKTRLAQFRISLALDSRKPLPESLRRKMIGNPSLQALARQARVLAAPLPFALPDASLHDSIMRSVRASARHPQSPAMPAASWLAASGAIASMALLSFWLVIPHSVPSNFASPFGGLARAVQRAVEGAVLP